MISKESIISVIAGPEVHDRDVGGCQTNVGSMAAPGRGILVVWLGYLPRCSKIVSATELHERDFIPAL
jgi:hypothetical protein